MREVLLQKVREAIEEPIVGNYLFDANELEEIYNEAAIYLQSFGGQNDDKNAVIFVALVNIRFWILFIESFLLTTAYTK